MSWGAFKMKFAKRGLILCSLMVGLTSPVAAETLLDPQIFSFAFDDGDTGDFASERLLSFDKTFDPFDTLGGERILTSVNYQARVNFIEVTNSEVSGSYSLLGTSTDGFFDAPGLTLFEGNALDDGYEAADFSVDAFTLIVNAVAKPDLPNTANFRWRVNLMITGSLTYGFELKDPPMKPIDPNMNAVPIPGALGLALSGMLGLGLVARRRNRS